MTLKRNIIANYLSHFYVTIIGIVILPLYIYYMGTEVYGLVGFFTLLQVWFSLLDFGLAPVLSREVARYSSGNMDRLSYRNLVYIFEIIFLISSIIGGVILYIASNYIATNWLQASKLSIYVIQTAIQIMAIIISIRFFSGLYRSIINGSEKLIWLSGFNSIIASIRFIGVIPVLIFIGTTPIIFFGFQLGVAVLEFLILYIYTNNLLPKLGLGERTTFSFSPLKPIIKFSLSISFASLVWIFITQVDKLILSKLLPLEEYGYFILAVLVASTIITISTPISTAIMPRLSKLEAENSQSDIIRIYRNSTQLVTVLAGSLTLTFTLSAESLLTLWTGNLTLAKQVAPILILYALGNGLLVLSAFPYYLQYAKGDLRLHLIGNVFFILFLIPFTIWMVNNYGTLGAGYAWLTTNIIIFFIWIPFIHHRLQPGLNGSWYIQDILIIVVTSFFAGLGINFIIPDPLNEWIQLLKIFLTAVAVILTGSMSSSFVRAQSINWYKNKLCHYRLFPSAS